MPNVPHTVRMVFSGTILATQSWSTSLGFHYAGSTGFGDPDAQTVADTMAASDPLKGFITDWWTALQGLTSVSTKLDKTIIYAYGADPTTPAMNEIVFSPSLTGTGLLVLPPEVALVASLRTARPGASYRGRSYFPLLAALVQSNGQVSGSAADTVSAAYAGFLSSMNGHEFISGAATKYTATASVISMTKTVATPITRVDVDTRFDSQRRRENQLPGATHSASV